MNRVEINLIRLTMAQILEIITKAFKLTTQTNCIILCFVLLCVRVRVRVRVCVCRCMHVRARARAHLYV